MNESGMLMPMGVWLPGRIVRTVTMLMMRVMNVAMLMRHGLVHVFVFVPLREVEVQPGRHECQRQETRGCQRLAQRVRETS